MTLPAVDIRRLRFERGQDLAKAAADLEISVGALSMYERGVRIPGPVIAGRIADKYDLTIAQIWPADAVDELRKVS